MKYKIDNFNWKVTGGYWSDSTDSSAYINYSILSPHGIVKATYFAPQKNSKRPAIASMTFIHAARCHRRRISADKITKRALIRRAFAFAREIAQGGGK